MTAAPRLSIGLPVYNGEDYVSQSLDALLGQSYEDFELIISDNASTDATADICQRYAKQDSRIRYIRQPRNIGLSPNHNFVFQQSGGELFKWAAADDLYGRDLLRRCIDALDEHPHVVLAHAWEAAIDSAGTVTQSLDYPLATDSPSAPERFRSILFGSSGLFESTDPDVHGLVRVNNRGILRSCDQYGIIRANVLRKVAPLDSYHHSDRIITCEIALHGPFHITPDWLYFRRDYPTGRTTSPPRCGPGAPSWTRPGPARCGTRPSASLPSTSGVTPRLSGARRFAGGPARVLPATGPMDAGPRRVQGVSPALRPDRGPAPG